MLELFAEEIDGRLHAAVVKKGVLENLYLDPLDRAGAWGSVYAGRAVKADARLGAAIVDLGAGLKGFLQAKRLPKPGQVLAVTVAAEGKRGSDRENDKLPRITVIDEEADGKPRLLRAGPDAIARAFLDYGVETFAHVHAAGREVFERVVAASPALGKSKRLRLFRGDGLFETHDLYAQLAALDNACVPLKSGGSLIIEQTAAFTVIDVNQGAGAAVNLEAATEALRQVRLRNASGAILIDFIGATRKADKARLLAALETLCAQDPASAQSHGLTRLGIAEITRRRRDATRAEKIKH